MFICSLRELRSLGAGLPYILHDLITQRLRRDVLFLMDYLIVGVAKWTGGGPTIMSTAYCQEGQELVRER